MNFAIGNQGFREKTPSEFPENLPSSNNTVKSIADPIFNSISIITPEPPDLTSILKREGFCKASRPIGFAENIIKGIQNFERDDSEYWQLFSLECLHFPEITSEEEAKELLAKYAIDPYVSPFIPEDSEMSVAKKLDATYETIMSSDKSIILVWFCCLYFFEAKKNDPELLDAISTLLQDRPDESKSSLSVFLDAYLKSCLQSTLGDFVETLSSLIPLEKMAKLRLEADAIAIVNSSFSKEIVKWKVTDYAGHKALINSLERWLDNPKHSFQILNLSGIKIERLPPLLLPYFENVKKLELGTHYYNIPDSVFTDYLPNLSYLTLSCKSFDENFSYNLLQTLTLIKDLKELDLSSSNVELEEIPDIANYCIENKITLLLPVPEKEKDLITLMNALGLAMLERTQAANVRVLSGSLIAIERENQYYYNALIEHMRTPYNLDLLNKLTELNLSDLCIGTLPEEICEFSGITSVVLNGAQIPPSKISKMIETLLKIPHLKWIDCSNEAFDEALAPFADQCNAREIMILRPISNGEATLLDFSEKVGLDVPEEYKNESDLLNQLLAQKESLENFAFLNLSAMNVDALPIELIQNLSNVKTLVLQGIYPERTKPSLAFNSLLKLPKLEGIDLSCNFISPSIFATLSYLLESSSNKIKEITLIDCKFSQANFEAFASVCKIAHVELVIER